MLDERVENSDIPIRQMGGATPDPPASCSGNKDDPVYKWRHPICVKANWRRTSQRKVLARLDRRLIGKRQRSMNVPLFWAIWLIDGGAAATTWLQGACPPAACSGLLVLMQAPTFAVGAMAWLLSGVVLSCAVPAIVGARSAAVPGCGRYCDGQEICRGDHVRIGKSVQAKGEVVQVAARGKTTGREVEAGQCLIAQGFIVRTDEGSLHHFLVANPYVVLLRRTGDQWPRCRT